MSNDASPWLDMIIGLGYILSGLGHMIYAITRLSR